MSHPKHSSLKSQAFGGNRTQRVSAGAGCPGVQARITCTPQIVNLKETYSNFDTLHLSVYADITNSDLLKEIDKGRMLAREYEKESMPFTFFSPQWNVHRSGRRFFTYHISMADTHVFFNERSVNGTFPTCLIEIGSISAHQGVDKIYNEIVGFLKSVGVSIRKYYISRVDLSTDFVGLSLEDFDLDNMKKWNTRANHRSVHYSGCQMSGISIGKGDLMARIYNKRKEMIDKKAFHKTEFFNRLWGEKPDSSVDVIRVEFQFRREVLKEFKTGDDAFQVDTLSDLYQCLDGIWAYCTKSWLKHCETEIDRKNNNHSQAKISQFWALVQSVTFDISKTGSGTIARVRKKPDYMDVQGIIDQGVGCMITAVACRFEDRTDYNFKRLVSQATFELQKRLHHYFEFEMDKLTEKVRRVFNSNNFNPLDERFDYA